MRTLSLHLGPTWIIQDSLPNLKTLNVITTAKTLFPCKVKVVWGALLSPLLLAIADVEELKLLSMMDVLTFLDDVDGFFGV